jgi:hypothetical protein
VLELTGMLMKTGLCVDGLGTASGILLFYHCFSFILAMFHLFRH